MAGIDYIKCEGCGAKIIYDGDGVIRDHLEFPTGVTCDACVKKLRSECERPEEGTGKDIEYGNCEIINQEYKDGVLTINGIELFMTEGLIIWFEKMCADARFDAHCKKQETIVKKAIEEHGECLK